MSSKNVPKYQLNQWINCCVGIHDLICPCNEPTKHLITFLLTKGEKYKVTPEEKYKIQQCLTTSEEEETAGQDGEDIIQTGDLERIFADDADGENAKG